MREQKESGMNLVCLVLAAEGRDGSSVSWDGDVDGGLIFFGTIRSFVWSCYESCYEMFQRTARGNSK